MVDYIKHKIIDITKQKKRMVQESYNMAVKHGVDVNGGGFYLMDIG